MRPQAKLKKVVIDMVDVAYGAGIKRLGVNDFISVITGKKLDDELRKVREKLLADKLLPDDVVSQVLTSMHPHSYVNNHLTDLYKKRYLSRAKAEGRRRWALQYSKGPRFRFFKAQSSSGVREGMKGGVGIYVNGKPIPGNPVLDSFMAGLTRQLAAMMADDWRRAWLCANRGRLEELDKKVDKKLRACRIEPSPMHFRMDISDHEMLYQHLREKAQLLPLTKGTKPILKEVYGFIPEPEIRIDLRQLEPMREITPSSESTEL